MVYDGLRWCMMVREGRHKDELSRNLRAKAVTQRTRGVFMRIDQLCRFLHNLNDPSELLSVICYPLIACSLAFACLVLFSFPSTTRP